MRIPVDQERRAGSETVADARDPPVEVAELYAVDGVSYFVGRDDLKMDVRCLNFCRDRILEQTSLCELSNETDKVCSDLWFLDGGNCRQVGSDLTKAGVTIEARPDERTTGAQAGCGRPAVEQHEFAAHRDGHEAGGGCGHEREVDIAWLSLLVRGHRRRGLDTHPHRASSTHTACCTQSGLLGTATTATGRNRCGSG